jgi:hypothetical protein
MNTVRFPNNLSYIYDEFSACIKFVPFNNKLNRSHFLLESENYCLKSSLIKEREVFHNFFNAIAPLNNPLVYKLLMNKNSKFLFHYNSYDIYAYEKIEGSVFDFEHDNVYQLGRSLALLHNLMSLQNLEGKNDRLRTMINVFLAHGTDSLYNWKYRKKYVLDFLESNPDIMNKPTNIIHGDMWSENIIVYNGGVTFIDFDQINFFYKDYEVFRCFFISLLNSIYNEKKSILAILEEYKDYFISYMKVSVLDLVSAFNFYIFVLCLECHVEEKAHDDDYFLFFLKKRQFLLLALIEEREKVILKFKDWRGDLNVT